MNRRLMAFAIKESALRAVLTPGLGLRVLHSDLPETAELHHIYNEPQRACFVAVFQDESFDETPEGNMIPFGGIELNVEYVKEIDSDE